MEEDIIKQGYEAYKWLDQIRMYKEPAQDRLEYTGDVFKIRDEECGLIITPRCDLTRPQSNTPVKMIDGSSISKTNGQGF